MKDSGSAPQPVDPYAQAAAQYGLSTGTANYNARLNRTNQQNALGSTGWQITGYDNPSSSPAAGGFPPSSFGAGYSGSLPGPLLNSASGLFAGLHPTQPSMGGGGAPIYTQTTHLAPQFESQLEKPIDTSGIAGMPGGPSTADDLAKTRDALYGEQMQYLAPEQKLQSEEMDSRLANMGATIGSPAWQNEQDRLAREQELAKSNARMQAITGGGAEQSRLFDMGSNALRNQIVARDAPISEFQALLGPQGGAATAATPDISGAFNQQYQGQLNAANAQTAANNANTSAAGSLLGSYLMYLALA